jgi:hypothetical protein
MIRNQLKSRIRIWKKIIPDPQHTDCVPDGEEGVGLLEEHQPLNPEVHEAVQQLQAPLRLRVLSLVVGNTSLIRFHNFLLN